MNWPAQVTAHLLASKRCGIPWPEAKQLALTAHPPRGRDAAPTTLFDELGRTHDTTVAFYWRVAEKAFHNYIGPVGSGDGPALRHFSPGALIDLDSSTPARKYRRAA